MERYLYATEIMVRDHACGVIQVVSSCCVWAAEFMQVSVTDHVFEREQTRYQSVVIGT